MNEKRMKFGDFIRKKRLADPRELSMKDVAEHLGVALSYISMVENRYKRPFDGERLQKLAEFLNLSEEDTATMYDLASHENGEIPYDIEETLMYEEVGALARYALRQSKKGVFKEEDWKTFIRETEAKKKEEQQE
jgi:transcriptional regulator with XRE-family HTH domain